MPSWAWSPRCVTSASRASALPQFASAPAPRSLAPGRAAPQLRRLTTLTNTAASLVLHLVAESLPPHCDAGFLEQPQYGALGESVPGYQLSGGQTCLIVCYLGRSLVISEAKVQRACDPFFITSNTDGTAVWLRRFRPTPLVGEF